MLVNVGGSRANHGCAWAGIAGLLGFIQEKVRLAEGGMAKAIYFGLMTASSEESAEEARQALHSAASQVAYTTVDAPIQSHSVDTATAHFAAPSALSAGHRTHLEKMAHQALVSRGSAQIGGPVSRR